MNQYAVDTDRTLSKRSRFAHHDGVYYSLTKATAGAIAANRLFMRGVPNAMLWLSSLYNNHFLWSIGGDVW